MKPGQWQARSGRQRPDFATPCTARNRLMAVQHHQRAKKPGGGAWLHLNTCYEHPFFNPVSRTIDCCYPLLPVDPLTDRRNRVGYSSALYHDVADTRLTQVWRGGTHVGPSAAPARQANAVMGKTVAVDSCTHNASTMHSSASGVIYPPTSAAAFLFLCGGTEMKQSEISRAVIGFLIPA